MSTSDEATITVDAVSPGGTPAAFPAIHDAYTENGNNFNSSLLRVENSSRKRISYLHFDTRSAGSATEAVLKLTQSDDVSSGTMTLRLYAAASNSWTESGITGSNAPAKGAQLAVLTDEGFAALEAAAPVHVESVRVHLFDQLTPEQVAHMRELGETLLRHLDPG